MPRCVLKFAGKGNAGRMDSQFGNVSSSYGRKLFDGVRLCANILSLTHSSNV
jgi:hypothetical protein